jgi:hypothetical protein
MRLTVLAIRCMRHTPAVSNDDVTVKADLLEIRGKLSGGLLVKLPVT